MADGEVTATGAQTADLGKALRILTDVNTVADLTPTSPTSSSFFVLQPLTVTFRSNNRDSVLAKAFFFFFLSWKLGYFFDISAVSLQVLPLLQSQFFQGQKSQSQQPLQLSFLRSAEREQNHNMKMTSNMQ